MSRNPLNTVAIEAFLDSARIATKTQQRELRLNAREYRDLADGISMVLARLVELQDSKPTQEETITVNMDGGKL
jgi:hypothetical protein